MCSVATCQIIFFRQIQKMTFEVFFPLVIETVVVKRDRTSLNTSKTQF